LGLFIFIGCLPAALIGILLEDFFASIFSSPALVACLLLVTGLILFLSERISHRSRSLETITIRDALLIGLAQSAAIAPGISRSGATIAAGLGLNINREAAARFSFLLSLPIILGAGALKLKDAISIGISADQTLLLVVGFLAAAVSGYACITFLLAYIRQRSLYLFTGYCWAFGLICLTIALTRG
jgi:undecaprenyl-diphosphatase